MVMMMRWIMAVAMATLTAVLFSRMELFFFQRKLMIRLVPKGKSRKWLILFSFNCYYVIHRPMRYSTAPYLSVFMIGLAGLNIIVSELTQLRDEYSRITHSKWSQLINYWRVLFWVVSLLEHSPAGPHSSNNGYRVVTVFSMVAS